MDNKSDIFFGIGIFLAFAGFFGVIFYIGQSNPENPISKTAIIPMSFFILSWIGIYLSKKFEKTAEDLEDEELLENLELAYDNKKNIVTLKEKLR